MILCTGVDEGLVEGTHNKSDNYQATGEFTYDEGIFYMMTVTAYDPDDSSLQDGNTGVITYMIMP